MIAARRNDINIVSFNKMNNITACYFDTNSHIPVDGEYLIKKGKMKIAVAMSLRKNRKMNLCT